MSSVEDLLSSSPLPAVLLVTDLVVEDGESQQKTDQDDVLFVNSFLDKLKGCLTNSDQTREDKTKSECDGEITDGCSFYHNFDSCCYYNFGSSSPVLSSTGYGIWSVRFAGICSFTTKYYSTNIAFWHCQYKQHNNKMSSFPLYVPLPSSPRTTATTPTSRHSQEETSTPSCYTSTTPGSFIISTQQSHSSSSCCRSGFIPRLHYQSAFSSPACLIYLCRPLCTPAANSTHGCSSVLPKAVLHSPWDDNTSPDDASSPSTTTTFNDYAASFSSSLRHCRPPPVNEPSLCATTAVDITISPSQLKDEQTVVEDKGGGEGILTDGDVSVDGENIDIKFVVICTDSGYGDNIPPYGSSSNSNNSNSTTGAGSSGGSSSTADALLYEQAKMWAADNLIETVVVRAARVVATPASEATNDGENTPPAEVADRLIFVAVDPEELSETGREKGQLPEEEEEDGRESGRYGLLSAGGAEYHTNGVERIAEALHANMWTDAVMVNSSRKMRDHGTTYIGGGGELVDSGRTADQRQGSGTEESNVCKETASEEEEEEQKDDKKQQIRKCSRGVSGAPPPPRCCGNVTPLDLDRFVGEIQNIREAGLRCSDDERRALAAETVMNIMKSLNIDEEEDEVSIMSSSCSETEDVDLAVPSV
eukprot:GHVS01095831.1.p1 GENE.GHVS01095831.1~~GHVS01095831.1.p1  ORF type:complete len:647 (+),score=196.69 GHVS01095831.1:3-1943(+)